MDCKQVQNKLIFYYYGELPEQEQQAIAEHLNSCQKCAQEYSKLKQVLDFAQAESVQEPNPFLWTRLQAKLKKQESLQWNLRSIVQPVLLAAVMIIGLFLGVWLGQLYNRSSFSAQNLTQQEQAQLFLSMDQFDNDYLFLNVE